MRPEEFLKPFIVFLLNLDVNFYLKLNFEKILPSTLLSENQIHTADFHVL
jgi:hypothetical protein